MYYIPIPFLVIATYTDITSQKIKNYITYPLILLGLIFNYLEKGISGISFSFVGIFTAMFLMTILSFMRFGGGDIKLMMGLGAFLGQEKIIIIGLYLVIFIAIYNLIIITKKEGIKNTLLIIKLELKTLGKYKKELPKIIGCPFIFCAYLIIIFLQ